MSLASFAEARLSSSMGRGLFMVVVEVDLG